MRLSEVDQFDLEDERGAGWDIRRHAALAVAQPIRDDQGALLALPHLEEGLVPTLDHLARADSKFERDPALVRAVKLRAVEEPAGIIGDDGRPRGRGGP